MFDYSFGQWVAANCAALSALPTAIAVVSTPLRIVNRCSPRSGGIIVWTFM